MAKDYSSRNSLINATRSRAKFSGHGNAKGAAGYRESGRSGPGEFLSAVGETAVINPPEGGFDQILIGAQWDNIVAGQGNFFERLFKKVRKVGVDIDIGCLYELHNGKRGAVQPFGEMFGAYKEPPYIEMTGDERTGDAEGDDEEICINGKKWNEIKRILVYVYIYCGSAEWATIQPQITIKVPGEKPLIVVPHIHKDDFAVCALAQLENVRGGIKLTNHTEYFPGHAEMDRAFGYGLQWADGEKI